MVNKKLIVLENDNHLNWKKHMEQIIPNLTGEC